MLSGVAGSLSRTCWMFEPSGCVRRKMCWGKTQGELCRIIRGYDMQHTCDKGSIAVGDSV